MARATDSAPSRPSGLFDDLEPAAGQTAIVYSDKNYEFRVHYGLRSVDEAGFYVYQFKTGRWKRVKAVSTANARLGRSPSLSESRTLGLSYLSVSWDYSSYTLPYIRLPLYASGSILFPTQIRYETEHGRYVLNFNPQLPAPFATVLVLQEGDLEDAFNH